MISRLWRGGRGIGTVVVAVVVVGAPVVPAKAADGDFDPTFDGGDGKVVSDFGFDDAAQSVAVQGDRIVAVGGRRRRRTRSPSSATLLRQLAAQPFLEFVRALLPRFGCPT